MQSSPINANEVDMNPGVRLSYQQGRAWASAQINARGSRPAAAPAAQCGMRLHGALDALRLRQGLQRVIDRYEILRAVFGQWTVSGEPLQMAVPNGSARWRCVDLCHCDLGERTERIEEYRAEDFHAPFAFDTGHLVRASLLTLNADENILILTVSALCADATTLQTMVSEIAKAYEDGDVPSDGENPIQYSSISEWQRSMQEEGEAEVGRGYWGAQPIASPPAFALQRLPHSEGAFSPSSSVVPLSASSQSRLREVEREEVVLLGCWLALLRVATGQAVLRVGLTRHGRMYDELKNVIGPLARVVPVVSTIHDGVRIDALVSSLAEVVDSADDWQEFYEGKSGEVPYEPLAFEYVEWPTMENSKRDLRWNLAFQYAWSERFCIKLALTRNGHDLCARLEFDPNVFDPGYVASLSEQLAVLIDAATKIPESRVDELPILSDRERRFLIETCNETRTDYPREGLLHQLISEQVARTPHRIAVTFQDSHLTFQDLEKCANRLAHTLRQMRVGPEVRVGIYMHRSLEMMIAILGVLKAGGAYVPIEPAYPAERVSFMLEDAHVAMILTQRHLRERLQKSDAEVLCLDDDFEALTWRQPDCEPESGVCSDNLAYALYTSGSTGRPKGAMISHRNMVNYLHWCCKAYSVDQGLGVPVHSSIGFDATITALFPALLVGRAVVLLRESDGIDAIPDAMEKTDTFSLIKITPAHLSLLNEFVSGNELASKARMLVIGGDALSGSHLSLWHRKSPETRFINEYGPTETVVGCCVREASETDFNGNSVPIGRPIANTQLYVLDERLNPLPPGIPGELFIAGEGVCRGYLGRPGITAERFLPDEFSSIPGSRMYRTGDLVVQRADGVLSFLGRLDHQVKIRSYRIEPGEIEAQLGLHRLVSQTVVVARTLPSRDKSLVAYVQCSGTARPSSDELRTFLLQKLPEYMVPSVFLILDKLPLTAHGKIDRGALPDPDAVRSEESQQYEPPRTPAESALATIWCDVLKLDRIGIKDDFFRSGGDSIQSILVVARAAKAGLRFTTRDLFRNPTIAGLAAAAEQKKSVLEPCCDHQGRAPLTPVQRWFFEQNMANPHHFNQSLLIEVRSDVKLDWLRQALEALVAHHDALRLRFSRQADDWIQEYSSPEGSVLCEENDLARVPEHHRQSIYDSLMDNAQSSLNITHGPLMRAVLIRSGQDQPAKLLLTVHHLVIDGVSWRILLDDFAAAYRQLANAPPVQLTASATSFRRWSSLLSEYANSDSVLADAAVWGARPGSIGCIPVDFDASFDRNTIAASASVRVALAREQTFTLLHSISDVYRTETDDLLLTALAQALAHWNGSRANLVDCEGHGREDLFPDADVSQTVGWFTSIYPVCLDLDGACGPGEELKAIKEQRRRIPHKGLTYGVLRYLSPNAALRQRLAALPRPQISFNYLGSIDQLGEDPVLRLASVAVHGEQDPRNRRPYLLDVIAYVQEESLHLQLVYSTALHKAETIERLGNEILGRIQSLLDHCLAPSAGGFTPSDFPDLALSQTELDELEAEFD